MSATCAHLNSKVIDSYLSDHDDVERVRRRECLDCGERFTTYEVRRTKYQTLTSSLQQIAALCEGAFK